MKVWAGKPISPGYAEGRAVIFQSGLGVSRTQRRIQPDDVESEIDRFRRAATAARAELAALERRVARELGGSHGAIFATHGALLADRSFTGRIEAFITKDLIGAEWALDRAVADAASQLAGLDDEYLRQRADDVRDLGRRVMGHLVDGVAPSLPHLPPDTVLVADELLPSQTIDLDRAHVRALALERCGRTSHAAILAKALGIPAVADLDGITAAVRPGTRLLVDGQKATVTASPTTSSARTFAGERKTYEAALSSALVEEREACVTRDGVRITLLANIGRVNEAAGVREHHLEGVGLFRTEILFLNCASPPAFDVHLDAYRQVAETLDGLPLVVRTLDLGGDKHPAFLPAHPQRNPLLGLRGLRYALRERTMLRTQLAALIDVARDHPVRVLFPMVLGGDDLGRAIEVLREAATDRGADTLPPVGAMIETPSALFALDEILPQVSFISLGTNDLTQFMLAADRDAADLVDDYSLLHPSVLRAVSLVASRAGSVGCPVSVCGEAAGDPQLAPVLAGLGIRELSMSPARAAAVRHVLRELSLADARETARTLLACPSLQAVRQRLAAAGTVAPASASPPSSIL